MNRVLVIFVGNRIMGDDAIALEVGEKLKRKLGGLADVRIADNPKNILLDYITEYEKIIVVDAIKMDKNNVGEVFLIEPSGSHKHLLTHGISINTECFIAKTLNPKLEIHIIGIGVEDPYSYGTQLSPRLKRKLPEISRKVMDWIKKLIEDPQDKTI